MYFKNVRRAVALIMCFFIMGTLLNAKQAEASASCSHSWGSWTVDKSANCTEGGSKHRYCTKCKKMETQSLAALGHSWGNWTVKTEATCITDGKKTRTCSRCKITGSMSITKLGHSWGNWTTTKNPTCTATGLKERKCTRCAQPEKQPIAAFGHNTNGTPKTVKATCVEDGYTIATCSRCHIETGTKTTIIKLGHSWGNWTTTKNPTCTATGLKERKCARCSQIEKQPIAARGHDTNGTPKTVKATCVDDGYTIATCSRCHIETGTKTTIKKLGHNWGNWTTTKNPTCTATGLKERKCFRCSQIEKQPIAALGHDTNGTPKTVKATCVEDGYTIATCSRCHIETGTKTTIKKLGHNWGNWTTTKNPTCTATGLKERKCFRCSQIEKQPIAALGHDTNGTPKTVKATCVEDGYTIATCSRCHIETGTKTTIKKLGHNWGNWTTTKNPTCTATGLKERKCTRCAQPEKQPIAALGHDMTGSPRIVQATCINDGYSIATCLRCKSECGTKTIIPATGIHLWGNWITDKEWNCLEKGKRHRVCDVCGAVESEEPGGQGHTVGRSTYIASTCENEGYEGVVCAQCGARFLGKTHPAKGHEWGEWIVDVEPTDDKNGKRHRVCKNCQKTEEDTSWDGFDYYIVHFDGNGSFTGTMEDMKCRYGEWFIVPECEFDDGDGFDCWSTTPDGKGRCFKVRYSDEERGIVSDRNITNITLYAIWKDCPVTYHSGVTKAALGNSITVGHSFVPKGTYAYPELQIDGLLLIGWGTNPNGLIGGKIEYKMGVCSINKFISDLYPVYRINDTSKWVVFYDPNGGVGGPGVQLVPKGKEDITIPEDVPTRTGYTFDGWEYPNRPSETLTDGSWIMPEWFENDYVRLVAKWKYDALELTLDYGYNGKVDRITVDWDGYRLPTPEREGFIFKGWGTDKNIAIYSGGQVYNSTEGYSTLYAVWEPIKFTVEYYDGFTNTLLTREETTRLDNILGNQCYIDGLIFEGWEEKIPVLEPDGVRYTIKVHEPYTSASELCSELSYNTRLIKLYSKYSFEEHDGIMVVYHPNGGSPWLKADKFAKTSDVVLKDGSSMKKDGCTFSKWINIAPVVDLSGNILVIAEWSTSIKLILRYGVAGISERDVADRFIPGQEIKVSDLGDPVWDEHYLMGWKDQKGNYYPVIGNYTIPFEDTILTAVWGENKYKVYYHNGFSGDLYSVPKDVGLTGIINYNPPKEDGYTFEGWVTGLPSEPPVGLKPKYRNGDEISFSGDLHLYSCFSEDCESNTGKITVVYNNKGGKGGPGMVTYDYNSKNPSFIVSKETPERAGYKFLGWSTSYYAVNVDYRPLDICNEYGIQKDRKVILYAVWGSDHTSDLKAELQLRFGKDILPDTYFDHEFTSPVWRKVNDNCYLVIKTVNEVDSDYVKYMTSTVMIVEFKNGKWSLESIGLNQKPSEALKYFITTQNNDSYGLLITLGIDVVKIFISLFSDAVGKALDICTVNQMLCELGGQPSKMVTFIKEFSVALCSYHIEIYREQLISMGLTEAEADGVLEARYDYIRQECEIKSVDIANQIFDVSETCLDIVSLTTNVESLCKKIGLDLNRELIGQNKPVINSGKTGLKINVGQMIPIVTAVIGMCIDISRWMANDTDLDVTGGEQERALYAFREELKNQGFSQSIYDEFPNILLKMYMHYYSITD